MTSRRSRAASKPQARRWGRARLAAFAVVSSVGAGCDEARFVNLGYGPVGDSGSGGSSAGTSGNGGSAGTSGMPSSAGAGNGSGGRGRLRFANQKPIADLVPPDTEDLKQDNPTLTANLSELYFTSNRGDDRSNTDVWVSTRMTEGDPCAPGAWGTPQHIATVSTEQDESSPAIAPDGSKLWVGVDRDDGLGELDIWEWTRGDSVLDWRDPRLLTQLNTAQSDIPRPPGYGGLIMPMASRRDGNYRTYFARRATTAREFGTPESVDELNTDPEIDVVDGFLTEDGLRIFYNAERREGEGDLWVAFRDAVTAPFAVHEALEDINTDRDQRDPWLSPDGTRFFYSSDEGDFLTIWCADVPEPDR